MIVSNRQTLGILSINAAKTKLFESERCRDDRVFYLNLALKTKWLIFDAK